MRFPEDAKLAYGGEIGEWDISLVNDTSKMFCGDDYWCDCGDLCDAYQAFNQSLAGWNTSSVVYMNDMFREASTYNQPLDSWDTSSVVYMDWMFAYASTYNQPLDSWDTSSVVDINDMFYRAYLMEIANLPRLPKRLADDNNADPSAVTGLDSCLGCLNCPEGGGECKRGFSRVASPWCNLCPTGTTPINGHCLDCPKNVFLSSVIGCLVLFVLGVLAATIYVFRSRLPKFDLDLMNLIRTKQIGAMFQVLKVFAELSVTLADWFEAVAEPSSIISMPVEVEPVCTSWYDEMAKGPHYYVRAWLAFFLAMGFSLLLRHAHLLTYNDELFFSQEALMNMQKLAAFIVMQSPVVVIPMAYVPESAWRILNTAISWRDAIFSISFSILSASALSVLLYRSISTAIRSYAKVWEKVVQDLGERRKSNSFVSKEDLVKLTMEDVRLQGAYYSVFCQQYTPREWKHELRITQRKIAWILGVSLGMVLDAFGRLQNHRRP